jgi:hypothetical protein
MDGNILYFLTEIAESAISGFSGFLKEIKRPISFCFVTIGFRTTVLNRKKTEYGSFQYALFVETESLLS